MVLLKKMLLFLATQFNFFKRDAYVLIDDTTHDNRELVDNFSLFEYMMQTHLHKKTFYVINNKHCRYVELKKKYKKHIIPVSDDKISFALIFRLFTTKYWLDSFQMIYSYGLIQTFRNSGIITVYMQHGINYFKLGNRYVLCPHVFNKVLVSNEDEFKLFKNLYNYDSANIIRAGLPRWQNNQVSHKENAILVYFTYRAYLNMLDNVDGTEYMQKIKQFLSSPKLDKILKKTKTTLYVALHHESSYQIDYLSKNVKMISEQDIGNIKSKANLFITDYSSMCFDFMRNNIPVIYYRIDPASPLLKLNKEDFSNNYTVESYNNDLYNIFYDYNGVLSKVEYYIKNLFKLEEKYQKINKRFFYAIPNIYEAIVNNLEMCQLAENKEYPTMNPDNLYTLPPNWPVAFDSGKIQMFNVFQAESEGVWSADDEVFLGFKVPEEKAYKIQIVFKPFVNKKNKKIKLKWIVNDHLCRKQFLSYKKRASNVELAVPSSIIGKNNIIQIKLLIKGICSPKELGISSDCRKLGIQLKNIKIS